MIITANLLSKIDTRIKELTIAVTDTQRKADQLMGALSEVQAIKAFIERDEAENNGNQ